MHLRANLSLIFLATSGVLLAAPKEPEWKTATDFPTPDFGAIQSELDSLAMADPLDAADGFVALARKIEFVANNAVQGTTRWNEQRDAKLKLWLHLVAKVASLLDPNFDPKEEPTINVRPPNGGPMLSGMRPDSIQDPARRAEYERAISANRRIASQKRLRSIDWIAPVAAYILREYDTKEKDRELVAGLLDEHLTAPLQKTELRRKLRLE